MKNELNKVKIIIALFLSTLVLVLIFGNYYIERLSGWAPPVTLTLILLLTLIIGIKTIMWLSKIYKYRKILSYKPLIPFGIYALTLLLVFYPPKWLYADSYLSEIKYRGCYEGTIFTSTMYFRESGEFEYRGVGIFGLTNFENGQWVKNGDTLSINYYKRTNEELRKKLILTETEFIDISNDSIDNPPVRYYRGYCKGLN